LNIVTSVKNLGLKRAEELPAIFTSAIEEMNLGGYSQPIKASAGIFILRLDAIDGGSTNTEKRRAQHILISAKTEIELNRAITVANRLKGQIEAGEDFAEVAKYYSDDSNSAANGGDLGWVRLGMMVPSFEKELFSMQQGTISNPVISEFGVHLIQLNEISITSDPKEYAREIAFNNLMTQKAEQYYPSYLSRLMGEAYIKYQ